MVDLQIPATQRAWRVVRQGPPARALQLDEHAPVPSLTDLKHGEVLVKVQAAALNPVGYKLMKWFPNFVMRRPWLAAENDLAGVVVGVHSSVTDLKAGDEVFGYIDVGTQAKTGQGSLCQFTRIPRANLALRPPNVSPEEAAGLTLAGLTAWQGFIKGGMEDGMTVFVNGGSSAVGAFAVQLAKARGCTVWASASAKNVEFVKSMGADEVVDYTAGPLHAQLAEHPALPASKFHVVFDAVALVDPSLYIHTDKYVAKDARFITTGPQPKGLGEVIQVMRQIIAGCLPASLGGAKAKYSFVGVSPDEAQLYEFSKFVEAGKVKPIVDSVFAFEDVMKAYERMMTNRATGKVVVKVEQ